MRIRLSCTREPMSADPRPLLVLYADISGSTALYETYGDTAARADCAACMEVMTGVAERFGGRLVKTIGDEVMCVFHDATRGAMAAADMQSAVRRAGEDGLFRTQPQRIKVGFHYGPGIEEASDVFGEAPITAQQMVGMAKADQVITSKDTLESLPVELRAAVRFVDRVVADAWAGEVEAYEMIWEVSGVTQVSESLVERKPRDDNQRLRVTFRNDLVSRNHAVLEFDRGRFHLTDMSSNGSYVQEQGGDLTRLRKERLSLRGCGRICLGGPPDQNPDALLDYEVE